LEIVIHGSSTKSKAIHNLLASHANGEKNPNNFSTYCISTTMCKVATIEATAPKDGIIINWCCFNQAISNGV
jgi:hypothetical protein